MPDGTFRLKLPSMSVTAPTLPPPVTITVEEVSEPIKNVVAVAKKNENTIGKLFKDAVTSQEFVNGIENDKTFDAFTRPQWWPVAK